MTEHEDETRAIKQALRRSEKTEGDVVAKTDVRDALRQRLQQEQRPGTALYITAQALLLATLLAAGLYYWLY